MTKLYNVQFIGRVTVELVAEELEADTIEQAAHEITQKWVDSMTFEENGMICKAMVEQITATEIVIIEAME